MTNQHLRNALIEIGNPSPAARTEAAAVIRDLVQELGQLLPAVAGLLVAHAVIETEEQPYEQMLFTLGELSVVSAIPSSVLDPLRSIEPSHEWEVEYIRDILENAGYDVSD